MVTPAGCCTTHRTATDELARYPLTLLQRGMLFNKLSDADQTVDTTQLLISDSRALDRELFELSWRRTIQLHEVLRTRFSWPSGTEPHQIVEPEIEFKIKFVTWSCSQTDKTTDQLRHVVDADAAVPLDLFSTPAFRITVLDKGEQGYHFLWTFHHTALDAQSYVRILADVYRTYDALVSGCEFEPSPPEPFSKYVTWLETRDTGPDNKHWQEVLNGFQKPTQIGNSTTSPGKSGTAPRGIRTVRISEALVGSLKSTIERHELTIFTVIMAAWSLLLHYHSGENDVVFGVTRSGRNAALSGIRYMVGLLITTTPMRVALFRSNVALSSKPRRQPDRIAA